MFEMILLNDLDSSATIKKKNKNPETRKRKNNIILYICGRYRVISRNIKIVSSNQGQRKVVGWLWKGKRWHRVIQRGAAVFHICGPKTKERLHYCYFNINSKKQNKTKKSKYSSNSAHFLAITCGVVFDSWFLWVFETSTSWVSHALSILFVLSCLLSLFSLSVFATLPLYYCCVCVA